MLYRAGSNAVPHHTLPFFFNHSILISQTSSTLVTVCSTTHYFYFLETSSWEHLIKMYVAVIYRSCSSLPLSHTRDLVIRRYWSVFVWSGCQLSIWWKTETSRGYLWKLTANQIQTSSVMPSLCHKCDLLSIIYVTCNGVRGERRGGGLHSCGGYGKHVRCLVWIMLTRQKEKTISNVGTIIHKLGVSSLIHATRHMGTWARMHTQTHIHTPTHTLKVVSLWGLS